jgi:hypothetical protein
LDGFLSSVIFLIITPCNNRFFLFTFVLAGYPVVTAEKATELQINVTNTGAGPQTLFGVYGVITHPQNFSRVLRNVSFGIKGISYLYS